MGIRLIRLAKYVAGTLLIAAALIASANMVPPISSVVHAAYWVIVATASGCGGFLIGDATK